MTVTSSVGELLARASSRERLVPADARSGAVFERVVVGSDRYFVKRFGFASDWIMRVSGDLVGRQYLVWQAGIMDQSPACIDHTVVAMDLDGVGEDAVLTIVMREVGEDLVPPGDAILPAGQHGGFIAHMAALHATFWGWDDQIGLTTMAQRILFFAPQVIAAELTAAAVPTALAAAAAGWEALPGRSPLLSRLARLVHDRPEVLTGPLAATPATFLAGDWKLGNLGTHPDGRTILLDWAFPAPTLVTAPRRHFPPTPVGFCEQPMMRDWLSEQRPLASVPVPRRRGAQDDGRRPGDFCAWFVAARELVGRVGGPVRRVRL